MIEEANAFEKIMKRKHDIPKPEYHEITLEQAIEHLKEFLSDSQHEWHCDECKHGHEQLLDWLKELEENRRTIEELSRKANYYQQRYSTLKVAFRKLNKLNCELVQHSKEMIDELSERIFENG